MKVIVSIILFYVLALCAAGNLQAQDWANLNRYQTENMEIEKPKAREDRVVFMGNSITEAWPIICPKFFKRKPYINRGISGQTTPQMLVRFRADVIELEPKVVVILAGTNDVAGNTGPMTIDMISDNIKSMAELAQANGITVVLSSVLPVFDFPWNSGLDPSGKIVALNEIIKEFAIANKMIYLDYFTAMVDDRNGLKTEYGDDGVHPNKAGYEVMAPLVEQAISSALNSQTTK